MLGDDERVIAYHNVIGADLDTGLVNKRLSIQTSGPTYHIQVGSPGKTEAREIPEFIRQKAEEAQTGGGGSDADPTEQLQRLQDLHEDGVISDEEFEEKRKTLLDKI